MSHSILNGERVLPDAIVHGPQQQKYIHLEDEKDKPEDPNPVGIFDDDVVGAPQGSNAPSRAPGTPGRRVQTRDKTGRTERSAPYARAAPSTPGALPGDTMMADLVDGDHWRIGKEVAIRVHAEPRKREYNTMIDGDLPEGFQDSGFATVRKTFRNGDVKTNETGKLSNVEETDAWTGFTVFRRAQAPFDRLRAMDLELDMEPLKAFIAQRIEEAQKTVQSGKVAKTVDIRKVSPEIKAMMLEARTTEWEKYKSFNAAIPIWGQELQNLLDEGHKVIPSKWVETDKNEHLKGTDQYVPKMKARLVICGNFEDVSREDVRCDAPTADAESHCLLASWAASGCLRLKGSDITNASFQAKPLTRVMLMRQPAGGMKALKVMPALYFHQDENGDLDAMLCTHVDDLLFAHKPSGAKVMEEILGKFSVGKTEEGSFRYCGRRFTQHDDFSVEIDAEENTRGIKPILIDKTRKGSETVTEKELTSLRSVTGSLAWVARYCRADLAYKVNELQKLCNAKATVSDFRLANKAVELAHQNQGMKLVYKSGWIDWKDLAVVTYSDFKSQQGRIHYLTTATRLGEKDHNIHVIGYASSTLKRVCGATLQAESYALQNAVEHGDRLRRVLCEMTGKLPTMTDWHEQCQMKMKHIWVSDCMSLVEHLNAEVPKKVSDKRLGIELAALRQSLWTGNGQKSSQEYSPYGDELWWTETARMLADALTKSMKPFRSDFFYLKHCAVAELLETRPERYTAVVLDADVVAVVLDRGLERWLHGPGELQFYQRIAGPEIMAGNYLARNVPWVREFLRHWALLRSRKPPGFSSADNGALHVALVNILDLEGAEHVSTLYSNLTALVDNLDPYWNFVRAAEKVLGPPRAWNLANTAFGQKTCTWSDSCVLTIWPRMNFFVDDGVYLGQKANGLIGPVMHHGIKNAHDVEHHYYQNVWSCTIDGGSSLVDESSLGHQAWQIAAGYPELYPQGLGCAGPQCAEACVSNFTCFPLDDGDEPLMRKRQRDSRYLFVVVRRVLCFAFALVVVLGAVRVALPTDFSTWLGDWVDRHDRPFACARHLTQDPHRELHRYVRRGEQCPSKHEGWFWIDR
eukprot:s1856_g14.t2